MATCKDCFHYEVCKQYYEVCKQFSRNARAEFEAVETCCATFTNAADVFEAKPLDIDEYKFTHIYGDVRVKTQTLEDYYKFKRDVKAEGIKEFAKELKDIICAEAKRYYMYEDYARITPLVLIVDKINLLIKKYEQRSGTR